MQRLFSASTQLPRPAGLAPVRARTGQPVNIFFKHRLLTCLQIPAPSSHMPADTCDVGQACLGFQGPAQLPVQDDSGRRQEAASCTADLRALGLTCWAAPGRIQPARLQHPCTQRAAA